MEMSILGRLFITLIAVFTITAVVKIIKKRKLSAIISTVLMLASAATLVWYLTPFTIKMNSPRITETVNGYESNVFIQGFFLFQSPYWQIEYFSEDEKTAFRNNFLDTELRVRRPMWSEFSFWPQEGYIQVTSYRYDDLRNEMLPAQWDLYTGDGRFDYLDPEYVQMESYITVTKKFLFLEYTAKYLLIDDALDVKMQALLDA